MRDYPSAAVERAMKVREVILRALGKRMNWRQEMESEARLQDQQPRRRHPSLRRRKEWTSSLLGFTRPAGP